MPCQIPAKTRVPIGPESDASSFKLSSCESRWVYQLHDFAHANAEWVIYNWLWEDYPYNVPRIFHKK